MPSNEVKGPKLGSLEAVGYGDRPVPNTFFAQDGETLHLGVILPGMGYTAHMPLLYYATELLLAAGADVLAFEYNYSRNEAYKSAPEEEQGRWTMADVTAACRVALAQRSYSRITVVGKSLGTIAAAFLLTENPAFTDAEAVLLTPVLRFGPFMRQVVRRQGRYLYVIGTADPHYDPALLLQVTQATGGERLVIEGADHSMEIAGDLSASLRALGRVVRSIEGFIRGAQVDSSNAR